MNIAQARKDTPPIESYTIAMVLLTGLFLIPAALHVLAVILA
jgi:hypothetical protein